MFWYWSTKEGSMTSLLHFSFIQINQGKSDLKYQIVKLENYLMLEACCGVFANPFQIVHIQVR